MSSSSYHFGAAGGAIYVMEDMATLIPKVVHRFARSLGVQSLPALDLRRHQEELLRPSNLSPHHAQRFNAGGAW